MMTKTLEQDGTLAQEVDVDASSSSSSGVAADNYDSTSTTPAGQDPTQTSSESSTLARAETAAVRRSKILVLFVLTLAAIGVSAGTYVFARQAETKEFHDKVSARKRGSSSL